MRKNSTRDFLTAWEQLNNSAAFKEPNFDLKKMSPTKWVECTGAAGIIPIRGRGAKSGIWSNADIAIEFMGDLSPQFKLFTIRELQRLKDQEASSKIAHEEWNVQRMLAKSHYQLQTDAIQSHLTQEDTIQNPHFVYASEADLINVIVYNMTAKQFRELNPGLSQSQNMRDVGTTLP